MHSKDWHPAAATALVIVAGWLWALSITGCKKHTSDRDLVLIDPGTAQALMGGEKGLFGLAGAKKAAFVDPRRASEFKEGHIPGAISLPFQLLATEQYRLKSYDTLVVYGSDYDDEKADGMSKRLMELGFSDVRTLHGGLRAWEAAGNEIESGEE